jgi:SpoVK/Ycf46/Vps4 family AAA+-type ATPase
VTERVVSQLLNELDGIEELKGVVVLAATNRLDRIDPALLRPGRFDFLVELPAPDRAARLAILHIHTRGMPLSDEVDLEALADQTDGFAGADLEGVCRRAALLAIREFLAAPLRRPGDPETRRPGDPETRSGCPMNLSPSPPLPLSLSPLEALEEFQVHKQHFEQALNVG